MPLPSQDRQTVMLQPVSAPQRHCGPPAWCGPAEVSHRLLKQCRHAPKAGFAGEIFSLLPRGALWDKDSPALLGGHDTLPCMPPATCTCIQGAARQLLTKGSLSSPAGFGDPKSWCSACYHQPLGPRLSPCSALPHMGFT